MGAVWPIDSEIMAQKDEMKKFKITKEISDKCLRDTAIHEAGHHIALTSLGGLGIPEVFRNPNKDPSQHPWRGRFGMMGKPNEVKMSAEDSVEAIADGLMHSARNN